jgi:hypothetical protein
MDIKSIREATDELEYAQAEYDKLREAAAQIEAAWERVQDAEAALQELTGGVAPQPEEVPAEDLPEAPASTGHGNGKVAAAADSDGFFADPKFSHFRGSLKGDVLRVFAESSGPVSREHAVEQVLRERKAARKASTRQSVQQAIKVLYHEDKVLSRVRRGHYTVKTPRH